MKSTLLYVYLCFFGWIIFGLIFLPRTVSAETQNQTQPTSSGATVFYISNSGVDPAAPFTLPVCTLFNPCATMTFAEELATNGDTIALIGGSYTENLDLDKALTIKGVQFLGPFINDCFFPCATILVDNDQPGIQTSDPLTLAGLIFDRVPGSFSSAIVSSSTLNLNLVTIQNLLSGAQDGAAIAKTGLGTLTVQNSSFLSNQVNFDGGAIFASGSFDVEINNSVFEGNSAMRGGAVYAAGGGVIVEIEDSRFERNSADSGGAIFLEGITSFLIDSAEIIENDAIVGGGLNLFNIPKTSFPSIVRSSTITGNIATDIGAGIYAFETDALINLTTIDSNTAGRVGGGIYIRDGSIELLSSAISKNIVECDAAIATGGGIHSTDSIVKLDKTDIVSNNITTPNGSCDDLGEAIYLEGSIGSFEDTYFQGNPQDGVRSDPTSALIITDTHSLDTSFKSLGKLTINRSEFVQNQILSTIIDHCSQSGADIDSSSIIHNTAGTGLRLGQGCSVPSSGLSNLRNSTVSCQFCESITSGGDLFIIHSTIVGRVHAVSKDIYISSSIIDGKCEETSSQTEPNGSISFFSINIASPQLSEECNSFLIADPRLEPLSQQLNRGGPSGTIQVHLLKSHSPAIGLVSVVDCQSSTSEYDQLGQSRNAPHGCDAGAVEFDGVPAAVSFNQPATIVDSAAFSPIHLFTLFTLLTTTLLLCGPPKVFRVKAARGA